ncbi:bactofilin family protein [Burkholderia singularis]|uniref:Integral membrane protein CcmA involved in cell shape determination n=1 Tax=Burkholderia singularis TaxID=1503053 RepID=A0A238H3D9_9BURK|nr:polymer-forming cytoskeletal protein [Burkholderia singularis]SMF99841.1 Integral membrane protein CcmA involved in cell shape determination [Burkholderia singularis]
MFGKNKSINSISTKITTLISSDVQIVGDVEFGEGLRIDGRITGHVVSRPGSQTLLVVSDQGTIDGNVHGYDVVVNGTINGDVTAEHFVELQPQARITGNIAYQQLRMDCGAAVDGKLTRRENTPGMDAGQPARLLQAIAASDSEGPSHEARRMADELRV